MQADFYILPTSDPAARLSFACKLTEKAWRLGHRVYLHCADQAQRDALDACLWQFKGECFVPHDLSEDAPAAPITLGYTEAPTHQSDMLVNLTLDIPPFTNRFSRVAEIVIDDPAIRQAARESFRRYREQGYALHDHRLQRF